MNVVCNMFVGPDLKVAKTEMEMTCGTDVFEEMWKTGYKGYTDVDGNMFTGYPVSDSDRCQAVDFDFESGVKRTSKSGKWSHAVCQWSRKTSTTAIRNIRGLDTYYYYTGFNVFKNNEPTENPIATGNSMVMKLNVVDAATTLLASGAAALAIALM